MDNTWFINKVLPYIYPISKKIICGNKQDVKTTTKLKKGWQVFKIIKKIRINTGHGSKNTYKKYAQNTHNFGEIRLNTKNTDFPKFVYFPE